MKATVFLNEQCLKCQRVTWKVTSKSPLRPSTPSKLITILVALIDESVDALILSLKVHGAEGHINLGASDEFLSELPLRLPPLTWPPSSLPSPSTPTLPFPGLVVDSVLPEVFNIEVSGVTIFPSFSCRTWHFDQALSIKGNGTGSWWSGYWSFYNWHITEDICPTSGQKRWEHLRMTWMVINQLDSMIVDPSVLREFGSQSGENAKSTYLSGTFVGAFSAIKPAIWGLREGWTLNASGEELDDATELTDPTWTT